MRKILFVFGTRPEAIKLAPVITAFRQEPNFNTTVCVTAQHRQMLDQLLSNFLIQADVDLNLMTENQSLFDITASALRALEKIYEKVKPDLLIAQGDTTTAFASSLAAFYKKIPVAHVEAGLRSHNLDHPYPEELNRIYIDRIAAILLAPTKLAKSNLLHENIPRRKIFVTGNTVIDALDLFKTKTLPLKNPILRSYFNGVFQAQSRVVFVTAHRRENFGEPLEEICKALIEITQRFLDVYIIYPVHLNPSVQKAAQKYLYDKPRILLTEPLDYLDLVETMKRAYIILTDSGGIQEEAPSFGKPVVVLRRVTERVEAIQAGCAKLVGKLTQSNIIRVVSPILTEPRTYQKMTSVKNPFGDGLASTRILKIVKSFFNIP